MPKNFKEELLFTAVMAGLMVLVMAGYNIALADGFSHHFIREVLTGYPLALVVAAICDLGIIGPGVKYIFFHFIINDYMKKKQIRIALTISVMMVAGMVTLMSLFGMVVTQNFGDNALLTYLHTWIFNLFMALPLQLLIVGPIARAILGAVQKRTTPAENLAPKSVED
ncbi:MAG: DUF2798 domain-containing protein [Levilactobacillus sp.]|jgi:hypothetical protein|uniref:DUF2798 domain-containing protein n=1 Tax=Levilactobacillus sp. TaxID=2767919 RepID=UPI0025844375|nr:DUF2798 domain-containing protein [Levilactobacillus sp.]MCI1553634.1 DUF2798 domain-containing protein [Levilactobacillus sp.]MCI1598617.1 DUF2798 domain-containing protein [Levilactobacillus sp.]MCI1605265.1 DUF2798 domain-containing protein [Levilactobacillus sp.]